MAAGAIGAIGAALGGVAGAFSKQSHAGAATPGPRQDNSTAALALAKDKPQLRAMQRNARDERVLALLTDPQVMGLLVTLGGLALATRVPFHDNPETNARIQGVAAAACVLMGLGRAGVGDLTTLTMAAGAGTIVGLSGESGALPGTLQGPGGVPLASVWGPIESLRWAIEKANR